MFRTCSHVHYVAEGHSLGHDQGQESSVLHAVEIGLLPAEVSQDVGLLLPPEGASGAGEIRREKGIQISEVSVLRQAITHAHWVPSYGGNNRVAKETTSECGPVGVNPSVPQPIRTHLGGGGQ